MILLAGATGSLGGKIARGLVARGDPVRALARPTSESVALQRAGIEVVTGDLKDPESLDHACSGVDVVIATASASKTADDSVENVDLQGNQNLIEAARKAGVAQFVFISTVQASPDHPSPLFRAKGISEQRLRESGVPYTILRPDAFMDVWFAMMIELPAFMGHPVTLVDGGRRRHHFIAESDVAAFAQAALGREAAQNATLEIGGPEALSFREAVSVYEVALGRRIPVESVAPGAPIPLLPEPVWGIAAALESYDSVIDTGEAARRFGVSLTSALELARSRVPHAHSLTAVVSEPPSGSARPPRGGSR